jgi:hypothetical protein
MDDLINLIKKNSYIYELKSDIPQILYADDINKIVIELIQDINDNNGSTALAQWEKNAIFFLNEVNKKRVNTSNITNIKEYIQHVIEEMYFFGLKTLLNKANDSHVNSASLSAAEAAEAAEAAKRKRLERQITEEDAEAARFLRETVGVKLSLPRSAPTGLKTLFKKHMATVKTVKIIGGMATKKKNIENVIKQNGIKNK